MDDAGTCNNQAEKIDPGVSGFSWVPVAIGCNRDKFPKEGSRVRRLKI